ncbi:acetoin utilization protein AcuC [Acidihalobacter ferrooxydans]|uniref:acetoin utilization protein AcuC n=1 Tax=Acidihalobacter ferrooxydans TaxID=1765967 RepID=UPI001E33FA33|nr:acetoin utilization protein AcuC [Acidihalobacter ferrooxydans]
MSRAVLIAASRYRRHSYGNNHPLDIPRVSLTVDLIRAYAALDPDEYLPSRRATVAELEWFHTRDYVSAMQRCEALGKVTDRYRHRHNIGNLENPWFHDFFSTPATATGGSIQAAEQVLAGRAAFSPAGGMHHAMPDRAQGFCFFNDTALAVMRLRREGLRVLYVDIDAHHGDGVEAALRDDAEAFTLSLHMDAEYAYPFAGGRSEDCGPQANAFNLPLPRGTNDSEYRHAFNRVWPAVLDAVRPDVLVLQAGTDPIMPDPLGKFRLSTQLFLEIVARVLADAPRQANGTPRVAVTGGGGYHPLILARAWTGVWGLLSGRTLSEEIPPAGQELLAAVEWGADEYDDDEEEELERAGTPYRELLTHRIDRPHEGEIRAQIDARVDTLLDAHPRLRRRGVAASGGTV